MKTTVIHHSADFDGLFCREIARKFLPDAELIGWDYGNPKIPMPEEGTVYILDLSPDCLCDNPKVEGLIWSRIIWIDHHKSAIEKFPASIPGYRIDGVAACRLAWQWFALHAAWDPRVLHPPFDLPSKEQFINREVSEPHAVRLAGEYDIWDKRDPNAELFQHGLRSRELTSIWWAQLLRTDEIQAVTELLANGESIQYFQRTQDASAIKKCGFEVKWEGLNFLACNWGARGFNSLAFAAGIKPEHDALLGYRFDGKKYSVSLYHAPGKEHHDLSLIASKYGGGGHRGACGFTTDKLPFLP